MQDLITFSSIFVSCLIKDKRLRNGKSKDRVSTEKITNLIVRHSSWEQISNKIIEADEEEVNKFGKG